MSASVSQKNRSALEEQAIKNFQDYLKIPSVQPNVDYKPCVEFLKEQAQTLGLSCQVHTFVQEKPVVVLTWTGTKPSLPSILLNSHMDVVPVYEDKWTHKPFSGYIDEHGNIYGRGAQDMKCVGIQYLEAIRNLKAKGIQLKRTIHISFVPDEEIGGEDGMIKFVKTKQFEDLNIGVALDEGIASPQEEFYFYYGERCMWQIRIHIPGQSGHGSMLLENTVGEKLNILLNKFFAFRKQEKDTLKANPSFSLGDVTTVNLTQIHGGVESNVLPSEIIVVFDIRISPSVDVQKFENMINQWCKDAGEGIWIEYEHKESPNPTTKIDDSNIYWVAFKQAIDQLDIKIKPMIFPAATDGRQIRRVGKPVFGFSPMNNTPVLLHAHDEYLNDKVFLRGIQIYSTIIEKLGNLEN